MNLRKATFVFGALLSVGAVIASAQAAQTDPSQAAPTQQAQPPAGQHGKVNPNRQAKRLAKQLNLSADQVAQIKPILKDRADQMQALRTDTTLAPADRRAKAKGIMDDSKAKIETVLNDQQKQQYEQMLAARKAKRQQNPQPGV
jgi:protein CpxP